MSAHMHSPRRGRLSILEWILLCIIVALGYLWKEDRKLVYWGADLAARSARVAELCAVRYMSTTDSLGADIQERLAPPRDTVWLELEDSLLSNLAIH